ncbi:MULTISPECIES: TetR/AcrR family transcriptional regulator [Bacillus]|uniref:TetR/AcrR family transcriptional regulator n=1 Tax=Bacillus TaxID=1386 RepID=UPI000506E793|nr:MULTISPECIES: TetR/AcrR family transcriptional regulator [Bacillus]KFM90011.1 bacterial regulatory s, tetR family protein [Bacillus paralicheniformis]MBU8700306.1 TetR/AcrR family transcriptional regulator [Bacillus paralicheniformis]MCD2368255.1 TetR/AcrR family transcriptional regulator [Bacillus sp. BS3(2021)]MCJ8229648.1 TetR/AcrR family transcriptional regulator [Bacillus paralicheniformis]MDR4212928.1 TetR/AcrR family transcriptional regulator [Bacillus paralicheniformis]
MSPRTKEQNEEIRRQRKQEILRAAILVYAEKGYSATEIGDIAAQARLARGLVYHYFKNKQTLFRELYEDIMAQTKQKTVSHFQQDRPPLELLSEYARLVCMQVLKEPALSRFYMRISLDIHLLYTEEQLSPFEWVKAFIEPIASVIEQGMQQGSIRQGSVNLMAMQFWGAISQGMNYLGQLQQEQQQKGTAEQTENHQLMTVIMEVTETALSIVRAE